MGYIGRMPYNAHINTLFKGDYTGFRPMGCGIQDGWQLVGGSAVVQIMVFRPIWGVDGPISCM